MLTLPPSFGTAHVGETFACTLCANNELTQDGNGMAIDRVDVKAAMQTPSRPEGVPLETFSASHHGLRPHQEESNSLDPSETLQRIVRFDLREEGNHVLVVTVTYAEPERTSTEHGTTAEGRVRTFRKLYQFAAQQLLNVRTKIRATPPYDRAKTPHAHVLEAQLENVSDNAIVLDSVKLLPQPGFSQKGLNPWDIPDLQSSYRQRPILHCGEVLQAAFLVQRLDRQANDSDESLRDGKIVIGQVSVAWRGDMGATGSLTTDFLASGRSLKSL